MKRILINATHNEEIRVALCKDNHLYDFDLENRTREQKKSNIYKAVVTRVEQSLEAVFVEYGSSRQGFLPLREIAPEYLSGNPREDNLKQLIKEGDKLIIQIEKEERGNKGAAVSTYISLAGSYLVLMPNNPKGGGISRQISGKVREEMRQIINDLTVPKGMSVIVRTAGIGKSFEELNNDLTHLLNEWQSILDKNNRPTKTTLLHQEAGIVTRAMRDYLRDDIGEVWIDSENAYNEAVSFIEQVMPTQLHKLRKYTSIHPMFTNFGVERQIETAYQREVRLPSGGSIVIDQTEALVSIDINSAKSTKGSDVAETAYHTNLEAADEIARQLRLRDMGGLIVIDFIDMNESHHQKEVEKRLIDATRYDRARVQFAEISKFGLMQMSRQRLRPSLDEATGYICPRCHGNGMVRDVRSLALSIMRQIEQVALNERSGEIQVDVPTEIAAFLLNEKRESLVYLEQDSGTRITILPHAHLESPNFSLQFNPDGYAPATYDRITDVEEKQTIDRGYDTNWHTEEKPAKSTTNHWQKDNTPNRQKEKTPEQKNPTDQKPASQAVAWLSNLFAPKTQASLSPSFDSQEIAQAIESIVNHGGQAIGASAILQSPKKSTQDDKPKTDDKKNQKPYTPRPTQTDKPKYTKTDGPKTDKVADKKTDNKPHYKSDKKEQDSKYPKREAGSSRQPRDEIERCEALKPELKTQKTTKSDNADKPLDKSFKDEAHKDNTKQDNQKSQTLAVRAYKTTDKPATAKVVHLSLDDSKKPQNNNSNTPQAVPNNTDKPQATAVQMDNQQTDNTADNVQASAVQAHTPVHTNTNSNHLLDNLQDDPSNNSLNDNSNNCLENNLQSGLSQNDLSQSSSNLPQSDLQNDAESSVKDSHDTLTANTDSQSNTAIDTDDSTNTVSTQSKHADTALIISDETLTKIAKQLKLAKNDPRVVNQALKLPIVGNAGAFIRQNLANADIRLAQEGLVACFVEVLNQQKTQDFSFANYGYDNLTPEFVAQFIKTTYATAKNTTPQGKTHATPSISVRAKNDPRGALSSNHTHTTAILQGSQTQDSSPVDDLSSQPTPQEQPQAFDQNQADQPQATQVGTVDEEAGNNKPSEKTADDNASDNAVDNTKSGRKDDNSKDELQKAQSSLEEIIEQLGQIMQSATNDKDKKEDDIHSVNNYKNMIENIAEQLLPQTGIMGLIPKANKVKIRKPKPAKPKTDTRKRGKKEVVSAVIIKKEDKTSQPNPSDLADSIDNTIDDNRLDSNVVSNNANNDSWQPANKKATKFSGFFG